MKNEHILSIIGGIHWMVDIKVIAFAIVFVIICRWLDDMQQCPYC
jgi:hypothetical protein